MPSPWQNEPGPDESCPQCGSVYEVTVYRYPARDQGTFVCEVCGHTVRCWNSTHDWSFQLKKRGASPPSAVGTSERA